uniref:N-acetyltransferase domain-containing protein n=1 Tax=viral metagenome TaxID=1070528 RepID=A0A6C0HCF2_9ZZZZ
MIFYSDEIINHMIDTADVNTMIDDIKQFIDNTRFVLTRYSINSISHKYTSSVTSSGDNIVVYYCFDNEFSIFNCPSLMIYNRYYDKENQEIIYYILLTCTKNGFRNMGFASKLFDGLKERISKENKKYKNVRSKMVLHRLKRKMRQTFYKK